ncbi:hypothetical protein [Streptomyces sp. KMM 9044]|uniref:hypothetical protein n=1 Tax=Streptomyces sp. KMM 9044 TaxID=2744474 RepID=UPI002151C3CF|nr:hypothetical protein [Streptomyces sp. KMM 9044]WAX80038.1 hypothetical protein HUV60_022605 [Streptomyces sp. KMM 9044]
MSASTWVSTSMPYPTPCEKRRPDAWEAGSAARGGKGSQTIVHAGAVPAPDGIAALLGFAGGEDSAAQFGERSRAVLSGLGRARPACICDAL